jgi:pimeloyl-ACP methyl ester carboxylesterase
MQNKLETRIHESGWKINMFGQGECVVLLPGFAETSSIWEYTKACLEKKYRVILPDYPGIKTIPYDTSRMQSLNQMAACLFELLRGENIGKVHLFGHSMGGYIALAFWELFPQAVSSIGLIHSTAETDDSQKKKLRTKVMEHLATENPRRILANSIPALFSRQEKYVNEIQQLVETGCLFENEALICYYKSMRDRPDRTHLLRNTTLPILLVAGKDDKAVSHERLILQSQLSDLCHLISMDQVGHMSMFESREILNNTLLEFLHHCSQQK